MIISFTRVVASLEAELELDSGWYLLRLDVARLQESEPQFQNRYRFRLWRSELQRINSSFPRRNWSGTPWQETTDELLMVNSTSWLDTALDDYTCASDEEAVAEGERRLGELVASLAEAQDTI